MPLVGQQRPKSASAHGPALTRLIVVRRLAENRLESRCRVSGAV
jgi:hypothetical protein